MACTQMGVEGEKNVCSVQSAASRFPERDGQDSAAGGGAEGHGAQMPLGAPSLNPTFAVPSTRSSRWGFGCMLWPVSAS